MNITELLEAHKQVLGHYDCQCGWDRDTHPAISHNGHLTEVLEQHLQEREAQAWEDCSDAWQDALNQDRFNPEEHLPPNPYRKESSDGR